MRSQTPQIARRQQEVKLAPLETRLIPVSYAQASEIQDRAKPLLSEDGAIETPSGFTLEPFVRIDGRLMTWADVSTTQSLEQNSLPLPTTTWHHPKFKLEIAPFGAGTPAAPIGYARYRLRNTSTHPERAQFYVAVRPLRVTPPWFELNINKLTAPIRSI